MKTKDDIIEKMIEEMPFDFSENIRPYVKEAMAIYAELEAISFAIWLEYNRPFRDQEHNYRAFVEATS